MESTIAATIEVGKPCHTDRIIAGRFGTKAQADIIAQQILRYVADHDVSIFHNNPPGQHGMSVFGQEDEIASTVFWPSRVMKTPTININHARAVAMQKDNAETAGLAKQFGMQSAAAADVASFVIGATAGPIVALEGAFGCVGDGNDDHSTHGPAERQGGVILAVRIAHPANEFGVILDLEKAGAADIEWADGEWRDGDWADFNPMKSPNLVALDEHLGHR